MNKPSLSGQLSQKRKRFESLICRYRRVVVAFSGGVDSTLLAKIARDLLGKENVLAVTANSASLAKADLDDAQRLGRELDLQHRVIATAETERPEYLANTSERCFFCKQTLFEALQRIALQVEADAVLYGVIADDRLEQRPGHRAAQAFAVKAPLYDAGFFKIEVRALAKELGLSNWNKPANACLASRVPHGQPVTAAKLSQVEQAESWLRARGFGQVRVRHLGLHARIDVAAESVHRFNDARLCLEAQEVFARLGFESVGINRGGYSEGSANLAGVDEVLLSAMGKC